MNPHFSSKNPSRKASETTIYSESTGSTLPVASVTETPTVKMSRRFSAEEKGKGVLSSTQDPTLKRIKAPNLDNSELIKENSLTLIGRFTNPQEQRIWALIPSLPRKWNFRGRAEGSDLGHNCFQFRFEREDDLQRVLDNRPYHFGYWMVILQKWEPVISPTFPSLIPFWIKIKGLPLHYWHDTIIINIGRKIGTYRSHELTKTTARVKVLVDGLKPLIKESVIEYASGEESRISLEYERLENHCSICGMLSHVHTSCPMKTPTEESDHEPRDITRRDSRRSSPARYTTSTNYHKREPTKSHNLSYSQRYDRHGNPFGKRVATKQTRNPPPEKTTSQTNGSPKGITTGRGTGRETTENPSPQYVHRREYLQRRDVRPNTSYPRSQIKEWREKPGTPNIPPSPKITNHGTLPQENSLNTPIQPIPTMEAVIEELQETTRQYLSCTDATESAARRQRVLQSEAKGDLEETAAGIIAAAKLQLEQTTNFPPLN